MVLQPLFICLIIYVGKVKFLKRFCVQSCTQVFQCLIVGWWVGFGCGWVKLNVLQKGWLVCRLAALLILRSVGILSTVFCSFVVGCIVPTLAANGQVLPMVGK
jgi:hypothetical protein